MVSSGKTKFLTLILLAVVGLSFATIWVLKLVTEDRLVTEDKPPSGVREPKRPRAEIEAACRQHVREAYQEASKAITRRTAEFSDFITSRKSGVKPFSKDLVSLYGKWRAVSPSLPLTDKEGHEKYVEKKFSQHIFTNQDLATAFKGAKERSVKDIESIENKLSVTLKREIFGQSPPPNGAPVITEAFKKIGENMVAASQRDVTKSAARFVVSEGAVRLVLSRLAVSAIARQVLARLGVSTGILTASATTSWWSFGTTLVIGLVVDGIWDWFDDPAGDIEREMSDALDKLSQDAAKAIEEEMNKKISQRGELWNKAVVEILS